MNVQVRSDVIPCSSNSGTQQVNVQFPQNVMLGAGGETQMNKIKLSLENDALRHSRGHGKLTYSYCFTLYRVLSASRWSLPLCGKLADTVS